MMPCWPGSKEALSHERAEGPRPRGDRGAAARRGMEPEGRGQEAPDVRLAPRGLRRVRGVAVREGDARAGAVRQRLRDGGLPEDPPALRRLPDAPELPDQEGGGLEVIPILDWKECPVCYRNHTLLTEDFAFWRV